MHQKEWIKWNSKTEYIVYEQKVYYIWTLKHVGNVLKWDHKKWLILPACATFKIEESSNLTIIRIGKENKYKNN